MSKDNRPYPADAFKSAEQCVEGILEKINVIVNNDIISVNHLKVNIIHISIDLSNCGILDIDCYISVMSKTYNALSSLMSIVDTILAGVLQRLSNSIYNIKTCTTTSLSKTIENTTISEKSRVKQLH